MSPKTPTKADLARVAEDLHHLLVPIASLHLDPENPRLHPDENVADIRASLRQYGQQKPVVTTPNGRDLTAGNGTLMAALAEGWEFIARSRMKGKTADEQRGFKIADNRSAETSLWNEPILARELDYLADVAELDRASFGFNDTELQRWRDLVKFQADANVGDATTPDGEIIPPVLGDPEDSGLKFAVALSLEDYKTVLEALRKVKSSTNVSKSGEALVWLAKKYLGAEE